MHFNVIIIIIIIITIIIIIIIIIILKETPFYPNGAIVLEKAVLLPWICKLR